MTLEEFFIFLDKHPRSGWFALGVMTLFFVLKEINDLIPLFSRVKVNIWMPLAKTFRFKFLVKKAIKSDIVKTVTEVTSKISNETLSKNLKPLKIEWIDGESRENFIREDKILVRIRPLEDHGHNLINVTQPYLESILIPNSRLMLEDTQRKAIVFYATSEVVKQDEKLIKIFHDDYYLPECIKYEKISHYYDRIKFINEKGFFYSTALTSIDIAAENARFSTIKLGSEFSDVLNHLTEFIQNMQALDEDKNPRLWDFTGKYVSYGLLLVARPENANRGKTRAYIERAREHLSKAKYLYVSFSNQEANFGKLVSKEIEDNLGVEKIGQLKTEFDYRGSKGGVIKIYKKLN